MTKVVILLSHIRIDDETTYRRGDVVDMSNALIERLGNSVKRLSDVNRADGAMPEAIQKKDAEIRALRAKIEDLELDVISLKDVQAASSADDKPQKKAKSPPE